MNEQEFAELSAAAALHALSPDDERRFVAALVAHPEWQRVSDADAAASALLAAAVMPEAPPAGIRSDLLARLASMPQAGGSAVAEPPGPEHAAPVVSGSAGEPDPAGQTAKRPASRMRILFALAACLALLVGVGVGAVALNDYLTRPASVIALQDIQAAGDAQQASVELSDGGTATAHWSASLGTAVLVTDGLAALPDDSSYELWFVRGDTPVSAGVFDVRGGDATALLSGQMQAGDVIAVTVEQAGGSPSGAPTSDPILAIPTA